MITKRLIIAICTAILAILGVTTIQSCSMKLAADHLNFETKTVEQTSTEIQPIPVAYYLSNSSYTVV